MSSHVGLPQRGCNKGGFKGFVLPFLEIGLFRPLSPFFCPFRTFPEGRGTCKKKAFYFRYPRICLTPRLLNPPLWHSNHVMLMQVVQDGVKGATAKFGPHPHPPKLLNRLSVHFLRKSGFAKFGFLGPFPCISQNSCPKSLYLVELGWLGVWVQIWRFISFQLM